MGRRETKSASTDVKSFYPHGHRLLHFHAPDIGVGRADAKFAFEISQLPGCADRQHLYASVVEISSPASDPEVPGRPLREISVADALYLSGNKVPPR